MKPSRLLLPLFLLLGSCGFRDTHSDGSQLSSLAEVDLSQVSFALEGSATVSPASPPLAEGALSALTLDFNVRIDASRVTGFVYSRDNWKVAFRRHNDVGDPYEFTGTVRSSGAASLSGTQGTVHVTLELRFTEGKLPTDVEKMLAEAGQSTGQRKVNIVPIYRVGDNKDKERRISPAISWAADVGVMIGGPTISSISSSDGTLVVAWNEPKQKGYYVRQSDGTLSQGAGSSSVSAYLLVYWDLEECGAGGEWKFRVNPEVAGTPSGRELTCSFGASGAAQFSDKIEAGACSLGCGTDPDSSLADRSEDEAAIPVTVPSAAQAGEPAKKGCYRVVRVQNRGNATSSFTIGDLKNDKQYGMVLWALDSSGHVSLGRSSCAFASPLRVPLPGDAKSGGEKKTQSDCFVATAASGSAVSPTVTYWRIIRDTLLRGSAFVDWYYRNGPRYARMLEEHPWLKTPIDVVLRSSGWVVVESLHAERRLSPYFEKGKRLWKRFLSTLVGDEAQAAPLPVNMQLSALGGVVDLTTEGEMWDGYYRSGGKAARPIRLTLAQTFSLLEMPFGEFGLGAEFGYFSVKGSLPAKLPDGRVTAPAVVGTQHVADGISFAALVSQRLLIPVFPWVALHGTVSVGAERLRMEPLAKIPENSTEETKWPAGYSFWKPLLGARGAAEIYWGGLFPTDMAEARFSYGLHDVGLVGFVEYVKDFSDSISRDALTYGGGLTFLIQ